MPDKAQFLTRLGIFLTFPPTARHPVRNAHGRREPSRREFRVTRGGARSSCDPSSRSVPPVVGAPAAATVLVHNHPGGDPMPSPEDRRLTDRFATAGHMLDIRVVDHLIIGRDRYVSFRQEGWL